MKTIVKSIILAVFCVGFSADAQVIIGNETGTAQDKTSVLLEFAKTNNKGIVLPYVRNKQNIKTEGSIILDVSDVYDARVKYFNGEWKDLSGQSANVDTINGVLAQQPQDVSEESTAQAVIGDDTVVKDGVLVLESKTQAMVLPTVDDVNRIPSPSPGMMVFVNKTGAKRLAVFNGTVWSFWKPVN